MPGDTATLAWIRRSLANSIEPSSRYFSGTGAQANMEAAGGGIFHPPAGPAFDQHAAARLIDGADLLHDVLGAIQGRGSGHLDGREGAIIEIGFDAGQR